VKISEIFSINEILLVEYGMLKAKSSPIRGISKFNKNTIITHMKIKKRNFFVTEIALNKVIANQVKL